MCIAVNLEKAAECAEKINVYNDGTVYTYQTGSDEFNKIICEWNAMICDAHDMPAFGVSLNRETVKAMESGVWVEFEFGCVYESNGMPYEKLLVNVLKEYQGFNIVRYGSERGYDGRCFYYDLVNKNMSNFYDLLVNLK